MPLLKTLSFIFVLSFSSSIIFAQVNLDSLNTLLSSSNGIEKVDILNTIAWELKYSEPSKALDLCNKSIDLSKAISYTEGEAKAYYELAAFSYLKGDFSSSLDNSTKSIALYESIDNSKGLAKNWNMKGMSLQRLDKRSEAFEYYEKALATCNLFEYNDLAQTVRGNLANMSFGIGDYEKALEENTQIASFWLEKGDSSNYYNVLTNIAKSQQNLGHYTEALSNFFKIETFEKSINRKRFLANNYNDIGILYLKLGLQEPTLEMFEKAIQLYQEIGNRRKEGFVTMNFGIYYSDNEDLEKAEFYYKKALHIYDSLGLNTGRVYNNIASLKIKTNKFEEALTLLDKSLKINQATGSKYDIALNYANMGAAYFELDQLQKAEQYYLKNLEICTEIGDIFEKQKNSETLAEIYKLTNNQKAFEVYSSIAQASNDSLFNTQKLIKINKLLVTNLHKKHKQKSKELSKELSATKEQIALLKNENSSFFSRYKLLVLSFLTILIIGITWFVAKYIQTSKLNMTLKNKAFAEQETFKTSLESKNKQLALLSLETAQKTDLFKKIQDSLQQIIADNPKNIEVKKLEKILSAHSLDQHNWENFNSYFNEVYVGFFERLSKSFPTITNKELRLCALIRLRIPSYEASIILGISPRSVHKSRYRIRKKMDLAPEANIDEFISSI